jgi:molybdopterin molybdotransferase
MLTYEEALAEVLRNVSPLEAEQTPLLQSVGLVVAEDVHSEHDLPMLDTSGPDGYAVQSGDVEGASPDAPIVLRIVGSVRAGSMPRTTVKPGTTMRIMTGSVVPNGADCVIPFESTDEPGGKCGPNPSSPTRVTILAPGKPGANIRPAGSNVHRGSLVVPKGTAIGPAQISALATIGRSSIAAFRRPTIAIISTGDELVSVRSRLRPGKSYDSNTAAVAALVAHCGAVPRVLGIARDNEPSLTTRIREGMAADAIITSGGVSKGDYDLVRLVVGKMGRVVLSRISMGPGASFAFGLLDRDPNGDSRCSVPVFALSGPPIGCLNNFETLVRPALRKMMGFTSPVAPFVEAVAEDSAPGKKPMAFIKWTCLDRTNGKNRADMGVSDRLGPLGAMATANALTIIPRDTEINKGDTVRVLPLDWTRDQQPPSP